MSFATLELLGMRVRIVSLPAELVPRHLHHLLRLLFFGSSDERFCHCSVTADGISMVASVDEIEPLLAVEGVQVDPTQWALAQVCEGQHGFSSSVGVVERITGPLASSAVPVLYVSTYSLDYVLIPVDRIDDAKAAVAAAWSDATPFSMMAGDGEVGWVAKHQYPLLVHQGATARLFCFTTDKLALHTGALLRLLLLPASSDQPDVLRAMTTTPEGEVTVVCGNAEWFGDYCSSRGADGIQAVDNDAWVPIRVGDECTPISEVGVVATQASMLSARGIPILYHSTFAADYTMVPVEYLDAALAAFEDAGFCVRVIPSA